MEDAWALVLVLTIPRCLRGHIHKTSILNKNPRPPAETRVSYPLCVSQMLHLLRPITYTIMQTLLSLSLGVWFLFRAKPGALLAGPADPLLGPPTQAACIALSPRGSSCFLAWLILHNWAWLSACVGQPQSSGLSLVCLWEFGEGNILCTLFGDLSYTQAGRGGGVLNTAKKI